MRLDRDFYCRNTLIVAKELLGKYLVHEYDNKKLIGKIVEVEAYRGKEDKACHSYKGRRTKRTETMYAVGGTSYVYLIYGMYNCFNVVSSDIDEPEAVLIRAVEPIEGHDIMAKNRYKCEYSELSKLKKKNLTNGPGKLCIALNINKNENGLDLCNDNLYILDNNETFKIREAKRIGIDYAEEAKDYLWRFYIKDNPYVSKKG